MEVQDVLSVSLAKAVTDAVPTAMQQEIFSTALYKHLFAEGRDGTSPLKEAFRRALDNATTEMAKQVLDDPANQTKLRGAVQEAFEELLTSGNLVQRIAKTMADHWRW